MIAIVHLLAIRDSMEPSAEEGFGAGRADGMGSRYGGSTGEGFAEGTGSKRGRGYGQGATPEGGGGRGLANGSGFSDGRGYGEGADG